MPDKNMLRSQRHARVLREKARSLTMQVDLRHSPSELWPFLSDTKFINQKLDFHPVHYDIESRVSGDSFLTGHTKMGGMQNIYHEFPFEWVQERFHFVERVFYSGVLKYLTNRVILEPQAEGTRVTVVNQYLTSMPDFMIRRAFKKNQSRMRQVYQEIDQALDKPEPLRIASLNNNLAAPVLQLPSDWVQTAPSAGVADAVASVVRDYPDQQLLRIRPLEISRVYGLDRQQTVEFFLNGTRQGWFELSWDLICPSCGGAKVQAGNLADVTVEAHCEYCNIQYGVDFSENVELTFKPAPRLRPVQDTQYCFGGPAITRHIFCQQNLYPGESRSLDLQLEAGWYRIRSLAAPQAVLELEVVPNGGIDHVEWVSSLPARETRQVSSTFRLTLTHPGDEDITVKCESMYWKKDALTAAYTTTLQKFRDLFSSEVLKPGVQLGVSSIALLFSDLKDSTRLYDTQGDARAFRLVSDHFDVMKEIIAHNHGGIVKTIGDAVMAVFNDNLDAVRAAVEIQQRFQVLQGEGNLSGATVKLGIHYGPCIVLNLNDKLDYFGSTVNKAARIQAESRGGDLVISRQMAQDPVVRTYLAGLKLPAFRFQRDLKGIQQTQELYRIVVHTDTAVKQA